jgi:hypothetical protein
MAYSYTNSKGNTYYLHSREVNLKGGKKVQIYWFAKKEDPSRAVDSLPAGYEVVESKRTALPLLKKK